MLECFVPVWCWCFGFVRISVAVGDMKIEELDEVVESDGKYDQNRRQVVPVDAKRALVGAGARILFYPTLLYNVFRNKIEPEFRWWDEIDQVIY